MAEDALTADVGVVLVHGIGQQVRGETLLEWVEPLYERIVLLAKGGTLRGRVTIRSANVRGDDRSEVWLDVVDHRGEKRSIRFTEARWAESFLESSYTEVLLWSARFIPKAALRISLHLLRHWYSAVGSSRQVLALIPGARRLLYRDKQPGRGVTSSMSFLISPMSAVGFVALALILALTGVLSVAVGIVSLVIAFPVVVSLGVVGVLLLVLLARIPIVGPRVRPLIVGLSTTVGDASVWMKSPIRAAAMRDVVRESIRDARAMSNSVVVIGHSQGAAIGALAVLTARPKSAESADTLVTLGAAVSLFRRSVLGSAFDPVKSWAARGSVRWINYWATNDPVSSGPIVSRPWREATARWRETYDVSARIDEKVEIESAKTPPRKSAELVAAEQATPARSEAIAFAVLRTLAGGGLSKVENLRARDVEEHRERARQRILDQDRSWIAREPGPAGPEERPVLNRGSLIFDHGLYSKNVLQVVDPIARLLLGPQYEKEENSEKQRALVKTHTSAVRQLINLRAWSVIAGSLLAPFVYSKISSSGVIDFSWKYYASLGTTQSKVADFVRDAEWVSAAYLVAVAAALVLAFIGMSTALFFLSESAVQSLHTKKQVALRTVPLIVVRMALVLFTIVLVLAQFPDMLPYFEIANVGILFVASALVAVPWTVWIPSRIPARRRTIAPMERQPRRTFLQWLSARRTAAAAAPSAVGATQ